MLAESFEIRFADKTFQFPDQSEPDFLHSRIKKSGTFYESEMLGYLQEHVNGPGYAIDCGANIGNHALFFAGVLGLKTLAVEPVSRNLGFLEQTVSLNNMSDTVEIVPKALDEKLGEVTMTLDDPGNHGMYAVGEGEGQVVQTVTVDHLTRDIDAPIKLMKIDVEGFQDQVIRGATKTLAKHKPLIVAELSSFEEYSTFLSLIAPYGYVPVDVFNRTPTMVFCADNSIPENSKKVVARIKSHDLSMVIKRPLFRARATLRRVLN